MASNSQVMSFNFALGEPSLWCNVLVLSYISINAWVSLDDPQHTVRTIFGDEVAEKIKPAWGIDEEGEVSGVWADSGIEGLYQMMGESIFIFVVVLVGHANSWTCTRQSCNVSLLL